mgnify:CR=1 FL=1
MSHQLPLQIVDWELPKKSVPKTDSRGCTALVLSSEKVTVFLQLNPFVVGFGVRRRA